MECNSIQEKLSSYIDEHLSPDEKAKVDEHLRGCPECRRSYEELKKTVAVARGLDEVEPPPWLEQKVMANIRQGERRKEGLIQKLFFPVHIKVPLEIVGTVVVAVTAFFVFRTIGPEIKTLQRMPEEKAVMENEYDSGMAGIGKNEEEEPSLFMQEPEAPSQPSTSVMRKRPVETDEGFTGKMKQREETDDLLKEDIAPEKLYKTPDVKAKKEAGRFASGVVGTSQVTEQQDIDMIIRVHNPEASAGRIEEAVKRLHGEIVRRDRFENKEIISVKIDPGAIEQLLQELIIIGQVQDNDRGLTLENLDGKLKITIELIQAF